MTNPPTTTQLFLLLDAVIVIETHRLSVWEALLARGSLAVPSVVAHDEAFFYDSELSEVPRPIHLPTLIRDGKIQELSAAADELRAVAQIFDRVFLEGLHEGEMEALALLQGGRYALKFCTADKMAIHALAMMDRAEDGISLETVLQQAGLQKPLERQFTQEYFTAHLTRGSQRRITGEGLA